MREVGTTSGVNDNTELPGGLVINPGEPELICAHCGDTCKDADIRIGDKLFCCHGCKSVYQLLHDSEMDAYYSLSDTPGAAPEGDAGNVKWGFLDDAEIEKQLLDFSDGVTAKVTLHVPAIHCASCIYLLEQMYRIEPSVSSSVVNFLKKEVTITWNRQEKSLREIVELLASVGYEPRIRLEDLGREERKEDRRRLYLQIGVAGFVFGNVMLLAFPDYLAVGTDKVPPTLRTVFAWVSFVLSLPVVFFSGLDYLTSAWKGIRKGFLNLDVPISLGVLSLLGWSGYEVISGTGTGYFDSLAGLIFLLLVGKVFQAKTYESLSFERDYTSYFPIAVLKREADGSESSVPVLNIEPGDRVIIRNQELVPADAVLMKGDGAIDYSFVTGESDPVAKTVGDVVYAGGRQLGGVVELEVVEKVSRSYLTRLWNHDAFARDRENIYETLANKASKYFVFGVLAIALAALIYWIPQGAGHAVRIFTAVLIVACPCALALTTPFTLGTAMRLLGRTGLYLKNAGVVERLARIDTVVFDKTGTLSRADAKRVEFHGEELSEREKTMIRSVTQHSTHPVSVQLTAALHGVATLEITEFGEYPGLGLEAMVDGHHIRIGAAEWVFDDDREQPQRDELGSYTTTFIGIDGVPRGHFHLDTHWRPGLQGLIDRLAGLVKLALLSGDTDREKNALAQFFPSDTQMRFRQSPTDKLTFIEALRDSGRTVLMIGDGLNDAGALKAGDVGIAITDDVTAFSPSSDALLDAHSLEKLDTVLRFSKRATRVILMGFGLSLSYNLVGLGFAVAGQLSPLVSAILMPLSSITVVAFATFMTQWQARRSGLS